MLFDRFMFFFSCFAYSHFIILYYAYARLCCKLFFFFLINWNARQEHYFEEIRQKTIVPNVSFNELNFKAEKENEHCLCITNMQLCSVQFILGIWSLPFWGTEAQALTASFSATKENSVVESPQKRQPFHFQTNSMAVLNVWRCDRYSTFKFERPCQEVMLQCHVLIVAFSRQQPGKQRHFYF